MWFKDLIDNLLIASDGNELMTMIQSNRTESKDQGTYVYANEGSYSLSLGGGEIKKLECLFYLKVVLIFRLLMRFFAVL